MNPEYYPLFYINAVEILWSIVITALALSLLLGLLSLVFRGSRHRLTILLLVPGGLGLFFLTAIPVGYEFYLAFTNMTSLVEGGKNYFLDPDVGPHILMEHLSFLFGSPWFLLELSNNLIYAVVQIFLHLALALGLAQLLCRPMKGKAIYRALLVLPWVIPSLASTMALQQELNFDYGIFNTVLRMFQLRPIYFDSDPFWGMIVAHGLVLWYSYPFLFMVVSGALDTVPKEYYEAAEVDGAGGIWKFRSITLPMIQTVLGPALVLDFIWTFNNANPSMFIPGAPRTMTAYVFWSFTMTPVKFGQAAAFALMVFFALFLFSVLAHRWFVEPFKEEKTL